MLTELLNIEVFSLLLVFIRLSTALFIFPGFSSAFIFPRFRLFVAFAMSFVVVAMVQEAIPPLPASVIELFLLIFKEVVIGIVIGLFPQFLMVALDFAGSMMGHSVGFSNASAFDPTSNTQSTVIGSFLSLLGLILILSMDLHHLMLAGLFDSYRLFVPGQPLPWGDFTSFFSMYLAKSFLIGFQISAPFFLLAILFNVGTGVISRLMPRLQILFIMMPVQVYLGLALLFLALPVCMALYMSYFEESIVILLQ